MIPGKLGDVFTDLQTGAVWDHDGTRWKRRRPDNARPDSGRGLEAVAWVCVGVTGALLAVALAADSRLPVLPAVAATLAALLFASLADRHGRWQVGRVTYYGGEQLCGEHRTKLVARLHVAWLKISGARTWMRRAESSR